MSLTVENERIETARSKAPNGVSGATLIHVFVTSQERQAALIAELRALANREFAHEPGCRHVTVARSLDGARVVMESIWSDLAAFRKTLAGRRPQLHLDRIRVLTTREIDVHVYDPTLEVYSIASYPRERAGP